MKTSTASVFSFVLALALTGSAIADPLGTNPVSADAGWTPKVPITGLAHPLMGLDSSRLHISNTISFGTGFGGGGQGLQTTSLSYQFSGPLAMSVSVGSAFGAGLSHSSNPFYLQGLDLAYRPNGNMLFSVHYQNMRSPLQYGYGDYAPGFAPVYDPFHR